MKELRISIKEKKEIEKFVLISMIRLMSSLREGLLTINECETYLYSPYSVKKLKFWYAIANPYSRLKHFIVICLGNINNLFTMVNMDKIYIY